MIGSPVDPRLRRLSQIMGPGSTGPTTPTPQRFTNMYEEEEPEMTEDESFLAEIEKARGTMPMTSAFRQQVMSGAPSREDYKPNWMTRIAAGLSGGSAGFRNPGAGIQVARDVNEAPWRNAYDDYSRKTNLLKAGSDIEQDEADHRVRQLMLGRNMGIDAAKLAQTTRYQDRMAGVAETNAAANLRRATDPNYEKIETMGGVLFVNKTNPSDRFTIPGETIASVNAKTNQRNASVNERNAGTNSRRADATIRDVNSRITDREEQRKLDFERLGLQASRNATAAARGQFWSPNDQLNAMDLALRELSADPAYSEDVIGPDSDNAYYSYSPEADEDFLDELRERTEAILSRRRR